MKRQEFIDYIAEKQNMTKVDAAKSIDVVFDSLKELILDGEEINVRGFGIFGTKERASRKSVDAFSSDKTNMIEVPASRKVFFKPGPILKNAVIEKYKK